MQHFRRDNWQEISFAALGSFQGGGEILNGIEAISGSLRQLAGNCRWYFFTVGRLLKIKIRNFQGGTGIVINLWCRLL